jgi:hypothetical protein
VFSRASLSRCIPIALVVGTILSLINQASVIFGGHATDATWIRVGMNYVVPFCVSSTDFSPANVPCGVPSEEAFVAAHASSSTTAETESEGVPGEWNVDSVHSLGPRPQERESLHRVS